MSKPIVFHTGPWTVGDVLMVQQIASGSQDMQVLVALLVSRSDASEEAILALPLSELESVVKQLAQALQTAGVLDQLGRSWPIPKGGAR